MIQVLKQMLGFGPKVNFKELISSGAVIIDVRTKAEYNQGHIKGSKNIPLNSVASSSSKINKGKPVITCCASGVRSGSAKSILKSKGFADVHNGGGWMSLKNKLK
jgi:rhodanese-related sulfurtransferase